MAKRALSSSWITTYYDQIDRISEAPTNYNMWAAVSVVSSVLKNHVYIPRGPYVIKPNQYIILVGPPGIGKGTAINPVYEYPAKNNLVNFINDRNTAPKMLEKLSKGFSGGPVTPPVVNLAPSTNGFHPPLDTSSAVIRAMELQTFLSNSDWMTTFLCETWDRDAFEYDTKNSGTSLVKNMCVSLISACVPAYIQGLNKETAAAINGGFTARSIFVYAEEKSKAIVWPQQLIELPNGKDIQQKLEDDLMQISNLKGEFSMEPDAKVVFEQFYNSPRALRANTDSVVMQHFKARIISHVYKLCMTLSVSREDSLIIRKQDMQIAINLLSKVQMNLDRVFRGFGNNIFAEIISNIQLYIERCKVVTRKEILKVFYKDATPEDLDRILGLLKQIDYIREENQGGKMVYILNSIGNGVVKSARTDLTS